MSTVKHILHKRMKINKKKQTIQTKHYYCTCVKKYVQKNVKMENNYLKKKSKRKIQLNKNIKLCCMLQL